MGKGGFKELRVWQKGKDLAVYNLSNNKYQVCFQNRFRHGRKPFALSHLPFSLSLWIK